MFTVLPDPVCVTTSRWRSWYWHSSRIGCRRCRRRSSGVETRVGNPTFGIVASANGHFEPGFIYALWPRWISQARTEVRNYPPNHHRRIMIHVPSEPATRGLPFKPNSFPVDNRSCISSRVFLFVGVLRRSGRKPTGRSLAICRNVQRRYRRDV
jgi:hypothetical protein